ncbi:MAG TPA: hypothetical protein VEZ47_02320, partial [Gemmatirosa sp.]|nr:hypothetical protein [Gemmatirosa sp.]
AALLAAGGTAWLARSQTLHARAVVRDAGPLRAEPSLGADPVAQSTPTDLARVDARQAAWSRVTLDGGRAGWMESSRLVPLD